MSDEPVEFPINGILDLHTFHPRDVKDLVPEYLSECLLRDIYRVRIIHGKGTGTLRRIVHSALEKSELVEDFNLAGEQEGGWGATVVHLKHSKQ
ncbi:MAG: DNA mismatch repair protein MutS [Candidatus Marinimicrobia bacterium]|nr:DNA mismatch repair protein MutS [Candidatus Neomarinimicrobiota bacterium]